MVERKGVEYEQLSREFVELQKKIEEERNKPKERISRERPI
jgi:hypothetical protein